MGREVTIVDSTVPIGTVTEIASLDTFVGDYVRCGEMVPSTSPIVVNSTPDGVYTTSLSAAAPQNMALDMMLGGNGLLVMVGVASTSINAYISSDGGISWTRKVTTRPSGGNSFTNGKGYINGRYLYWGTSGILEITANGSAIILYTPSVLYGIDWDGTQWISALSGGNVMSTSIDLITWELVVNRPANSYALFKVGANYVSISSTFVVSTTTTLGTAWTTRSTQSAAIQLSGLRKVNSFLVAKLTSINTFVFTADGLGSWTSSSLAYDQTMTDMVFDGTYYIVNNGNNIYYRYSTTLGGTFTTLGGVYSSSNSAVACDGTRTYMYNMSEGFGALTAGATVPAPFKIVNPFYTGNSSGGNNIYQVRSTGSTNILYNSSVYRLSGETISLMVFDNANKYLSFTESSTNQIYYHIAELNGALWWTLDNAGSTLYKHVITAGITTTTPSSWLTLITSVMHYAGEDIIYVHPSNCFSLMRGFLAGATSVLQSDNGNFISMWKTGVATQIWYNGVITNSSTICKLFSKSGASVALATNTTNVRFWKIGDLIYTDNGASTGFIYAGTRLDRMVEIFATVSFTISKVEKNGLLASSDMFTMTPQGLEQIKGWTSGGAIISSTLMYVPHSSVTSMFNYTFNDSGLRRTSFVAPATVGTYRYIKYK